MPCQPRTHEKCANELDGRRGLGARHCYGLWDPKSLSSLAVISLWKIWLYDNIKCGINQSHRFPVSSANVTLSPWYTQLCNLWPHSKSFLSYFLCEGHDGHLHLVNPFGAKKTKSDTIVGVAPPYYASAVRWRATKDPIHLPLDPAPPAPVIVGSVPVR